MINYDNSYYERELYHIAYKILLLNPWKDLNYFDFYFVEPYGLGHSEKYILNFENYDVNSDRGKYSSMKTIWIHLLADNVINSKLKALCCVYTSKDNIPKTYFNKIINCSKLGIFERFTPFFVDMRSGNVQPFDFNDAEFYCDVFKNVYKFLLNIKIAGSNV